VAWFSVVILACDIRAWADAPRVLEKVEAATTCIRYFPSVTSCLASSMWDGAERSESCSRADEGPCQKSEVLKGARVQRRERALTAEGRPGRRRNGHRVAQFPRLQVGGTRRGIKRENLGLQAGYPESWIGFKIHHATASSQVAGSLERSLLSLVPVREIIVKLDA
jgi:hypothetical protein